MACDASNEIARPAENVFQVPAPAPGTACIRVRPGDKIILPIDLIQPDEDPNFRITEADGTLVIAHGGVAVLLQDFVQTLEDADPVIVTEVDHTPIDLAYWLAIGDPNVDIITGP